MKITLSIIFLIIKSQNLRVSLPEYLPILAKIQTMQMYLAPGSTTARLLVWSNQNRHKGTLVCNTE